MESCSALKIPMAEATLIEAGQRPWPQAFGAGKEARETVWRSIGENHT
jgi:hypothetical protein